LLLCCAASLWLWWLRMVRWAATAGMRSTRCAACPWIWGVAVDFVWGCAGAFSRGRVRGVGVSAVRGDGAFGYLLLYVWWVSGRLRCGGSGCLGGDV
jgi:hypothetical protein